MDETEINIARTLDHTLLRADVTAAEIHQLCQEAMEYGFAGVCVNSTHIAQVAAELAGSNILPVSVVGFPLGACTTETKVFETLEAVRLGAREIDMVINVGWLKSRGANGERDTLTQNKIENEIRAVVKAAGDAPVKVIIETCLLTDGQKIQACLLAKNAGAAFVKTSTGFSTSGATEADVRLMRQTVGPEMGVKASGGIRTAADARKMLAAGANRLGVSASVAIVAESVGESVGNSASQNAADPVKPGY